MSQPPSGPLPHETPARTSCIFQPPDPVLSGEDPKGSAVRKTRGTPLRHCPGDGGQPRTPRRFASLSGKPRASATTLNLPSELALLSVGVRSCMPAVVVVVTQLVTQPAWHGRFKIVRGRWPFAGGGDVTFCRDLASVRRI